MQMICKLHANDMQIICIMNVNNMQIIRKTLYIRK